MGYNQAKQNMTRKVKIVSLLLASIMLFFVGCKKNNPENETNETSEETNVELIPEEILQLLDNCPSVNYQDPSVFGFNGKSDNPLDNLFNAMCQVAMHLTNNTEYIAGVDPVKEPRQRGLAYVYGYGFDKNDTVHYSDIKDYRKRRRGWEYKFEQYLHGIDCSGFIAHVMDSVGIKGKKKSLFQMKAWEQVEFFKNLTELNTNLYSGKVKVKEYKNVSVKDIKNGDILYKITTIGNDTATHIGIVFKRPEDADLELTMFQSSGRTHPKDSLFNLHENDHGPIQKKLNVPNLNKYFEIDHGQKGFARLLRITTVVDTNWVDLNLPSNILWATRNIGANSPEQRGYYFAWGETEEDSYYDWIHYNHWTGTVDLYGNIINGSITKYNEQDHLTILQPNDDAAFVHLGGSCRMPTKKDWKELFDNTTYTWDSRYGVKGVLFKEKNIVSNGDSLFLPAVGFRHEGGIFDGEHYPQHYDGYGFYWTSSLDTTNSNNAWYVRFKYETETPVLKEYLRLFGLPIRPVRPKY